MNKGTTGGIYIKRDKQIEEKADEKTDTKAKRQTNGQTQR